MDINAQIANNKGLVYAALHRFNLVNDPEAESYAFEALFKAVMTFDDSKGYVFATYAVACINNGLRMYCRKLRREVQRQKITVSLDDIVSRSDDGHDIRLADVVMGETGADSRVISEEKCAMISNAFVRCKNALRSNTHRDVVDLYYMKGLKQGDIAKAAHVSQPQVSRIIAVFKHKLELELEGIL